MNKDLGVMNKTLVDKFPKPSFLEDLRGISEWLGISTLRQKPGRFWLSCLGINSNSKFDMR